MSDFPAVSDYDPPYTPEDRANRTQTGDLIREHRDLDIPTPVRWRPAAPKPTLGAAITRLLEKS